ncbi:hypothetical protein ABZ782_06550 [Streptomyces asoensis]|uniref:hypothetical protein n=1 Tax=Streptomyces asoensis TaxID=249586 RepID=UPI0033F2D834
MAAQHSEGPGGNGAPIPRDLPDQQAGEGEDPWDVGDSGQAPGDTPDVPDSDVPDTDESGTGRRGAPHADIGQSDDPVPEEPSA